MYSKPFTTQFAVTKEPTNSTQPLVSIVTPTYNSQQFIEETLRSVKQQTYGHWEHIIVDDGSTDNTIIIVENAASKETRIKLIQSSKNQGAAEARNLATQHANGDYIAFLDSDDLWHPNKLEAQLDFMYQEDVLVSYTSYVHMDEKGTLLGKRVKALSNLPYLKQHKNNYIGNLTGIYNAKILGKIIAPNIRKRQDWAVWLEAIKRSEKPALGIQQDLAMYRVRSGSISANKLNLVQYNYKFYRDYLGYSWVKSAACLAQFFWEYFLIRPRQIERY